MEYSRKIGVFFDVIFRLKKKHHHIGILRTPTLFSLLKTVLIAALFFFNVVQKSIRSYLSSFAHASSLCKDGDQKKISLFWTRLGIERQSP
jgi:hypothetical protein